MQTFTILLEDFFSSMFDVMKRRIEMKTQKWTRNNKELKKNIKWIESIKYKMNEWKKKSTSLAF